MDYEDSGLEAILSERVRFGELFDAYGAILTKKQREACEAFLAEDLTAAEIGVLMGKTRQGAYDLVKRSRGRLEETEERVGLLRLRKMFERLLALIDENEKVLSPKFLGGLREILKEDGKSV